MQGAPPSIPSLVDLRGRRTAEQVSAVIRSGALMFEFMGWPEVGKLIEDALGKTIVQHRVTYDLERLMVMDGIKDVQTLGTSGFAGAIIENM